MRALKLSILGLVLGAASLAAQAAVLPAELTAPAGSRAAAAASPLDGNRLLFYRLPADSLKAARKSFVIRVSLDGRPFADETFRLGGGQGAPTVELFALAADLRDRVYEKAGRPDHFLTVTVLLDGRAVSELTWGEFLRYNQEIRQAGFRPSVVPSEVKSYAQTRPKPGAQAAEPLAAKGVYRDPDCVAACDAELDFCLNQRCDPRGDDCTLCYIYYNDSILNCPMICEDPKKVEDYTTQTLAGTQYIGPSGCYHSLAGGNYNYAQYQYTIKNTQYRKTTYCNGTTSTQELSYWYTYTSCFQRGSTCPTPYSGTMYWSCNNN